MSRSARHLRLAIGVAIVLLAWPKEAILGTYGSYTMVRRGYTIAQDIAVGSHADHTREAVIFREREARIDAQVKPLTALYDKWYQRVFTKPHPYAGWLGALDRERTKTEQWDYKSRLPGPVARPSKADDDLKPLNMSSGVPQIYLHMKPAADPIAHGRTIVGFALAQAALGDTADFLLRAAAPLDDPNPLAEQINYAAHADFFSGQPHLVAALIVNVAARQSELAQVANQQTAPADVRLLAQLVLLGLQHKPWSAADWPRLEAAKTAIDWRTLWTWMLIFAPAAEQSEREAELKKRLPLPDGDTSSYYREFVHGKAE